jgi:LPPG:FO 2-phospho-L-lactate transferase
VSVSPRHKVIALSGGIGGAKLALGLSHVMDPRDLVIVANTGDDFEHLGLAISPDMDTLLYTLAGVENLATGWGRRDETWTFMRVLKQLGGPDWFQLGDGDLALHVERSRRLQAGESLSAIMDDVVRRFGLAMRILPATDDRLRTRLKTDEGWLDFQDYFVRLRCAPRVETIRFDGADRARAHPDLLAALADETLRAVVICPSNPFISIEPILAIPGLRDALRAAPAPVIAVSPIIGGRAVKGPTAKMMEELGLPLSAVSVAERYDGLLNGYVLDRADAALAGTLPVATLAAPTLMTDLPAKMALAQAVLAFADSMRP